MTLAGGCFWCLDALYRQTRGVRSVVSGYIGGHMPDPFYEAVCTGQTGHAEAVQVTFDENVIPSDVILDMFFAMHDPTSLNRQGYDVGTQYRSAMFAADEAEAEEFRRAIENAQKNWDRPIVTTIENMTNYYAAEDIHQNYYAKFPEAGYCQVIVDPKLSKVRQSFGAWLVQS